MKTRDLSVIVGFVSTWRKLILKVDALVNYLLHIYYVPTLLSLGLVFNQRCEMGYINVYQYNWLATTQNKWRVAMPRSKEQVEMQHHLDEMRRAFE